MKSREHCRRNSEMKRVSLCLKDSRLSRMQRVECLVTRVVEIYIIIIILCKIIEESLVVRLRAGCVGS